MAFHNKEIIFGFTDKGGKEHRLKGKIIIRWSCPFHHEHKWKWTASICGQFSRLISKL